MKKLSLFPFLTLTVFGMSSCASGTDDRASLEYEKYRLPNGLEVVLHQDTSDPVVSVAIQYHVGSNREKPGKTGFAHFFEHMLFQRSENLPRNAFFQKIDALGGTFNGGTSNDGTVYFETVPRDALEKVLWMESDRMGYFINTVTEGGLKREIDVVSNEKRQGENVPYGLAWDLTFKNLFPQGHPYSWTVIGEIPDLRSATVDDVKEFYDKYYTTSNATLVVAGDFDKAEAKKLIEKYFGEIPDRGKPEAPQVQNVTLDSTKKISYEDVFCNAPMLLLAYPGVETYNEDGYALDFLTNLLAGDKKSPLYKVLVEERKLAPEVEMFSYQLEVAGLIVFDAKTFPGVKLDDVQAAFDEAVKNHKDDANASGDNNFYTNDNSSATVDYKTVVTSSQGGTTTSDPQTAAYPQKPTITLPVSKITVTKTWSDDNENHANDSVQVQLKQDGEDYANGSATLNAAGNWTHEFTVPAGPEGHTYSVSEVKVEGYDSKVDKTDLKLQGLTAQSGAFTVTNTPSYVTLPASDVKVTKVVQGHAANSDFGFNLKCVDSTDANAGKCADVTGLANNGLTTTVSKDELTASGASATVGFGNGDLKFRVPTGADNLVYTFEASEDTEKPAAGWKYDNDKVTVKVTVSRTDAVVSYEYGENDSDRTNTESAQFTNKYVAISSLPLTGGTTGRDWMVFGGGLGLLALLAAAGYTVWRKRQLV